MSGTKLFVDTNIALYLLEGDETIVGLLDGRELYVSVITELELLGYRDISNEEIKAINRFLQDCRIVGLNDAIKKKVIELRRAENVRLPDAIIISSSQYLNIPLISADKGFKKIKELELILYQR